MTHQLILARTTSGCAALIVNQVVVAHADTTAEIDKLVTTAARQLSTALHVPLVECEVEPPEALDGKWEWQDLFGLLPAATGSRSINGASAALKAHETALGIEGGNDIQLWHLLVSLLEYSAARDVDFDTILAEVKDSITSGEIEAPASSARLRQTPDRD